MSAYRLTAKQRSFADRIIEGMDPSEAYHASAYKSDNMTPKAISVEAQRVLQNPSVALAIEEGRQKATERAITLASFTKEEALRWAMEDRELAHKLGQSGAAVSATRLASDLGGHIVEKKDLNVRADPIGALMADVESRGARKTPTHDESDTQH